MSPTPINESGEANPAVERELAALFDPPAYAGARVAIGVGAVALGIFGANSSGLPLVAKIALVVAVVLTPPLAFEQWALRRQLARALGLLAKGRGL